MAIELSPPSPADPTPPRAPAANTAGKPSSGFSSVLQGLGDAVAKVAVAAPTVTTAVPVADAETATDPVGVSDVAALVAHSQRTGKTPTRGTESDAATPTVAKKSASLSDVPDAAPVQPSGGAPASAAQALLAQFLGLAGAHGAANAASAVDAASGAETIHLQQATPVGALVTTMAPSGTVGGPAPQASDGLSALGTPAEPGLGAVPGAGAGKRWLPAGSARPPASWQSTVTSVGTAQDARALPANARNAAQEPSAQALEVLAPAASAPVLAGALAESDQGLSSRRRGTAVSESPRLDAPTPAGMTAATSTAGAITTSAAGAPGQVLEQAVAEQVKYWISNDVHNAQLKFDGLGPQSVQVNISLSGNQAQVVFQSDQPHTRELLSNAMGQLEQMLRGEGLTLTAAWVGSSGQQGQFGSSAQQAQPGPQRAPAAMPLSVEAVSAPARTQVSANRALDLFV